MPAKMNAQCQPRASAIGGTSERRDDGADIRARVEDGRGRRAFAFRKPQRDGFDGGGKVTALTEAERDAGDVESADAADKRVARAPRGSTRDRDRVADLRAELVDRTSRRSAG